jgi:hypothetical protein
VSHLFNKPNQLRVRLEKAIEIGALKGLGW